MNLVNYKRAQGYAYKIVPQKYKDIVHDAYVRWFDKTGRDLFDEHPRVVIKVVKNVAIGARASNQYFYGTKPNSKRKSKFVKPITIGRKTWLSLQLENFNHYEGRFDRLRTEVTPLDLAVAGDSMARLESMLTPNERVALDKFKQGYKSLEIAQQMGVSSALANYYLQRIRKKSQQN